MSGAKPTNCGAGMQNKSAEYTLSVCLLTYYTQHIFASNVHIDYLCMHMYMHIYFTCIHEHIYIYTHMHICSIEKRIVNMPK